jgi:FdhD protein
MGRVTDRRRAVRFDLDSSGDSAGGSSAASRPEVLVVEEPLEIRIAGRPFAVTMRTPGDDIDLVHGYLHSEGVIAAAADLHTAVYCAGTGPDGEQTLNVLDVTLADGVPPPDPDLARAVVTTSACGICGSTSIEAVRRRGRYDVAADELLLDPAVLAAMPDRLRAAQRVFDRTGGLHAAGLFTAAGELVSLAEDVGRHNAVDKVVGRALRDGALPLTGHVLMVSGRASFELTQKAALAGVPVLAAVSAPSTLAVDLAGEVGLTLVGFLRPPRLTAYAGAHRLGAPENSGR